MHFFMKSKTAQCAKFTATYGSGAFLKLLKAGVVDLVKAHAPAAEKKE